LSAVRLDFVNLIEFFEEVITCCTELLKDCIVIYIKGNEMKTGERQSMWHTGGEEIQEQFGFEQGS